MSDIPLQSKKPTMGDYLRSGSCTGEPKTNALNSLRNKDLTVFTDIVNTHDPEAKDEYPLPDDHWINKPFPDEDDKTLLMIAIEEGIEQGLHDYVQVLLQVGASAKLYNNDLGRAPIHVAAKRGDLRSLKLLFQRTNNRPDINSTLQDSNRTALHICCENKNYDSVMFLLDQPDIDVNAKDSKGSQTPLYIATKAKSEQIARALIAYGADLDDRCFGKSLREHLKIHLPHLDPDSITRQAPDKNMNDSELHRMVDIITFKKHLAQKYFPEFTNLLLKQDKAILNSKSFGGYTLLQRLTEEGMTEFVKALLKSGKVDPNGTREGAEVPPLLIAANKGNSKIIEALIENKADLTLKTGEARENILHILLKKGEAKNREIYEECLNDLLSNDEIQKQLKSIVNKRDLLQNTPLHYATQMWPQEIVRKLLEAGANIGMKNHWDDVPISKIRPDTMEDFLDEFCIDSKGDVNHENFEVTFNYSFLAPPLEDVPYESREGVNTVDPENQKLNSDEDNVKVALPETQALWYMGQSKEHRHLLKHPVVTSFLYLKWGRIRKDFNRNLRFYLLFVFMLTWYVFEKFGGMSIKSTNDTTIPFWHSMFFVLCLCLTTFIIRDWIMDIKEKLKAQKMKQDEDEASMGKIFIFVCLTNWFEMAFMAFLALILFGGTALNVLWISLLTLNSLLVLREFLQVTVSLKRYLLNLENWMEVTVICLTFLILIQEDTSYTYDFKRHLSAVAIVLSWAELITLVGKHPKLSTYNVYVVMFYKVMGTFFFFLCWYAFFIIAFGLGFYIMLHKDGPDAGEIGEDDYIFFNSPWLALVKTSTMFVGELEFSDIPIDLGNPFLTTLAYFFFLTFVFLIVVVLMNLLNGLAVSDTGEIQEKAEIFSYKSSVETISYTEAVLLGDPFNFLSNWPALKWLKDIPSCSFCAHLYKNTTIMRLFHRFTGATRLLLFYNVLPDKKLTLRPNSKRKNCNFFQVELMDQDIISSAKDVVLKKTKQEDEKLTMSDIMSALEARLQSGSSTSHQDLEGRMTNIERKLDLLLSRL